jgi:hypothetical protein
MAKRAGITLVEVLVAILIMGVGMLAILTLFPVGLLNCRQAMRDDRVVQAGSNASAIALARNVRHDTQVEAQFGTGQALVYVDPFYANINAGNLGAGNPGGSIPRTSITLQNAGFFPRWFSLVDDYTFQTNGIPQGTPLQSGGVYTWAYLLRRPRNNLQLKTNDASFTDLAVVVYEGRNTAVAGGETPFSPSQGNAGDTTLIVPWTASKPAIGKTGWILDLSTSSITNQPVGQFYRIVSMIDSPTASNTVIMETQTPLKNNVTNILVMEKVAEVLERGTGWAP